MNIGDLVRLTMKFTGHGIYEEELKVAMIIEGPNEVGKIKLLLSDGATTWRHCSEVEYMPKNLTYLKE